RAEELAQPADDARAGLEDATWIRVHHQVEVALPVARLDVLEPVPLLRQRMERLREEAQVRRLERELVRARAEGTPGDADQVAEIEEPVGLEALVAEPIAPRVDLNATAAILD